MARGLDNLVCEDETPTPSVVAHVLGGTCSWQRDLGEVSSEALDDKRTKRD